MSTLRCTLEVYPNKTRSSIIWNFYRVTILDDFICYTGFNMKFNIRLLYLYLFSFVGLLITIIGGIQLVDLGMKNYIFKVNEYSYYYDPMVAEKQSISPEEIEKRNKEEQSNQTKRTLSNSIAMILIGLPVYFYHWGTIKKEQKN